MKFKVDGLALKEALNKARHATPSSPSMIAFGGVLLVVDESNSELRITGSDGETTITSRCEISEVIGGQVLLPPKPIISYLSNMDSKSSLTIETSPDGDILIGDGEEPYRFRPLAASFPTPIISEEKPQKTNLSKLQDALSAVRHATSKDSPCVQVISKGNSLTLHTTDNYRLARAEITDGGFGDFTGILPIGVLDRVSRLNPNAVSWDSRTRTIVFHCADVKISTRLLASSFPAVETVLSAVPQTQVLFETSIILSALSRLAAVADQAPVSIRISERTMELKVSNADLGSGSEKINLSSNVSVPVELHIKLSYLVDAIASTGGKIASFAYAGAHQPLFVLTEEPNVTIQVIMPIRV